MVKRAISLVAVLLVLLSAMPVSASVTETEESIEYLEDGSYIVTTIEESVSRAGGTKTGSKVRTYYDAKDVLQWKITVTGIFTYNGTSATCTAVSGDTSIVDTSSWSLIAEAPTRSGNKAMLAVTLGEKWLGITIAESTYTVNLSCDENGNLS